MGGESSYLGNRPKNRKKKKEFSLFVVWAGFVLPLSVSPNSQRAPRRRSSGLRGNSVSPSLRVVRGNLPAWIPPFVGVGRKAADHPSLFMLLYA